MQLKTFRIIIVLVAVCVIGSSCVAPRNGEQQSEHVLLNDWPYLPPVPIHGVKKQDHIVVYVLGQVMRPGGYYVY